MREARFPDVGRRAVALAMAAALGSGAWMLYDGSRDEHPPQPSAADAFDPRYPFGTPDGVSDGAADPVPGGGPTATHAPVRPARPLPPSVPVRIRIPAIGVDAPFVPLRLDRSGQLQVPPDSNRNLAGWYRGGPSPGSAGNAIVDGHVDTRQGPAVFYNLGSLHKGNTVEIDRADGRAALFAVDAIEVYAKKDFPSKRVYGPTKDAQLRLITCGGGFSTSAGYLGNVVLYAHLTGTGPRTGG